MFRSLVKCAGFPTATSVLILCSLIFALLLGLTKEWLPFCIFGPITIASLVSSTQCMNSELFCTCLFLERDFVFWKTHPALGDCCRARVTVLVTFQCHLHGDDGDACVVHTGTRGSDAVRPSALTTEMALTVTT